MTELLIPYTIYQHCLLFQEESNMNNLMAHVTGHPITRSSILMQDSLKSECLQWFWGLASYPILADWVTITMRNILSRISSSWGTSRFIGENRWEYSRQFLPDGDSKEGFFEPLLGVVNDFKDQGKFRNLGKQQCRTISHYATLEMHTACDGTKKWSVPSPSYALGCCQSDVKMGADSKEWYRIWCQFLKSKITLTFDYYISHTTNLLYGKPIPLAAGKYYYADGWINPSDPTINGRNQEPWVWVHSRYNSSKGSFSWV